MSNRRTRSNRIVYFSELTSRADFHKHLLPSSPKWDLVKLCAAIGLAGGPLAATVGLLFVATNLGLRSVGRSGHSVLETVGSVLLISIIPMLMLGAHCLDKLDERIANNLRPPSNGSATAAPCTVSSRRVLESRQVMAMRSEEFPSNRIARGQRPIQCVTENGFSIIRLSEIRRRVSDTEHECRFLVRNPRGSEREVSVEFNDRVVALVQARRRNDLSLTSTFWLICAERCLASYLWENDNFPDGGRLNIVELSVDELLLATYWSDQQGGH